MPPREMRVTVGVTIDWPGMLADLERQRAASVQEIEDIDAVIATVRRRAGVAAPAALQLVPPARKGAHRRTKNRGRHGRIDDAEVAAIRKDWEAGVSAEAIAKKFHKKPGRIYYLATTRGWKRQRAVKTVTAKPEELTRVSKVTDAMAVTMRQQYEKGEHIDDIGGRAGVSGQTVRNYAAAGKWKRPPVGSAKPEPTPKGGQLAGSVKCTNPDCGVMTDYDPCRRCGTKLKRKWG